MTPIDTLISLRSENGTPIVLSRSSEPFISSAGDFLDMLAWGGEREATSFLLKDVNFAAEFYDLKSGLAGELLQKVSNYRVRLAIAGSFAMVTSERFREFMAKSNKGRQVRFSQSESDALIWLST